MTDAEYRKLEMRNQLNRGPYPGENFFRLKVTGNGESRWINITHTQLASIALIVGERD